MIVADKRDMWWCGVGHGGGRGGGGDRDEGVRWRGNGREGKGRAWQRYKYASHCTPRRH